MSGSASAVTGDAGPPAADDRVARTLAAWVAEEFRPWAGCGLGRADLEAGLREAARRDGQVCLFRIRDGTVEFAPFTAMHRPFLLDPRHSGGARALLYLQLLREAVRAHGVHGSALVGVFVADLHLPPSPVPVFGFQKPAGTRHLLLPDVDLLGGRGGLFDDAIPFEAKRPHAIFVGSTTGSPVLTLADVAGRTNARIDAALFFRDHAEVTFHLPNIVQCDGAATRVAIAALGVGSRRWSWPEQQACRYALSLDGNGATCSRVAAALAGHQVLAKYDSPHLLFYFRGLRPWRHYVPIAKHQDVLDLLAAATSGFALHRAIAARSRRFARRFLTRAAMVRYSAMMLSTYVRRFGEG